MISNIYYQFINTFYVSLIFNLLFLPLTSNANKSEDTKAYPWHFFDSNEYRCCFGKISTKIGAIILSTCVFHEVIISTIYVYARLESGIPHNPVARLTMLFACRLVQLLSIALFYFGILRYKSKFLIPFALMQPSVGAFTDINTLLFLLDEFRSPEDDTLFPLLPLAFKWIGFIVIALIYIGLVILQLSVLYKCYNFIEARNMRVTLRKKSDALTSTVVRLDGIAAACNSSGRSPHSSVSIHFSTGGGNRATASNLSLSRISIGGQGDDASMRNLAASTNRCIPTSNTGDELRSSLL